MDYKPHIYWIGEHAYEHYQEMNAVFLEKFVHTVLLFDHELSPRLSSENVVYLTDLYPFIESTYSLDSLTPAFHMFAKNYIDNKAHNIIVGDPIERLFQAIIMSASMVLEQQPTDKVVPELFSYANKVDSSGLQKVNLLNSDLIQLYSDNPFEEIREERNRILKISLTGFGNIYEQTQKTSHLNDLLWSLLDHDSSIPATVVKH